MKITERKLRKIIRKQLLEYDLGFGDFIPTEDDTSMAEDYTSYMMTPTGQALTQAGIELAIGLTPAGLAVDAKDFAVSYNEGDGWGILFSGIGFIPIAGDLVKNAHKLKKLETAANVTGKLSADQAGKIKKLQTSSGGKIDASDIDEITDVVSSGKTASRTLIDIARHGFKKITPEARHFELIHASHVPNLSIDPLAGRVTRQSRKGKLMAGFYAYPKFQEALANTPEGTINRAKNYVSDMTTKNPEIDTAYIYKLTIDPAANFVEQINPTPIGLTRIPVEKAKEYYNAGIDVIITKSAGLEEVIIINDAVITSKSMTSSLL